MSAYVEKKATKERERRKGKQHTRGQKDKANKEKGKTRVEGGEEKGTKREGTTR